MYNSVVCSTFNVKCSWDRLLEGRNCSCVWSSGAQSSVASTRPSEVRFGSWAEPDSYWSAEDWFNDGRVELFQQLLWQVELPQLVKEVQPLLGLFHNGLNVIAPIQVLRDGGSQEPEWLHCSHSAVHDGEWGESRGFLLKSMIISTVLSVLSSRLLRLHQTASSLTSCL